MDSSTKARVLIIEDDNSSAGDYMSWLREGGHTVERDKPLQVGVAKAESSGADVVLLDLQIPSVPDAADEDIEHGFRALDELLKGDPFRPVVIVTAHSKNRELMRRVLQRTHGGQFVFKDDSDLEQA